MCALKTYHFLDMRSVFGQLNRNAVMGNEVIQFHIWVSIKRRKQNPIN